MIQGETNKVSYAMELTDKHEEASGVIEEYNGKRECVVGVFPNGVLSSGMNRRYSNWSWSHRLPLGASGIVTDSKQ